jgi:hypothetical protein
MHQSTDENRAAHGNTVFDLFFSVSHINLWFTPFTVNLKINQRVRDIPAKVIHSAFELSLQNKLYYSDNSGDCKSKEQEEKDPVLFKETAAYCKQLYISSADHADFEEAVEKGCHQNKLKNIPCNLHHSSPLIRQYQSETENDELQEIWDPSQGAIPQTGNT